jgi:anthranilate synthase component II
LRLLVIDNYDSFTFNLVHLIEKVSGIIPDVVKNDRIDLSKVDNYDKLLLSPGPGIPSEAGLMPPLLDLAFGKKDILGVCLGHQALAEKTGCRLRNLPHVVHGMSSEVTVLEEGILFKNCPRKFQAARYHSWVVDETSVHPDLSVTAVDSNGIIMAFSHRRHNIHGVQFHPESVLSECGDIILKNWLEA